jgi:stage II sporulation protein AA (anti-sigma F factor antagonist)
MVCIGSSFLRVSPCQMSRAGPESGASVLWLRGEHDISTVAALSAAIDRAVALDEPKVVIEMSEVEFMSAATVGVIVRANENLRSLSRSLTLVAPSPCVRRIFAVCGLSYLFEEMQPAAVPDAKTAPLWPASRGAPTLSDQFMPLLILEDERASLSDDMVREPASVASSD